MGKKREKGKARKAKAAAAQLAATQQAPFNVGASTQQAMVESEAQAWRFWVMVGQTYNLCAHGCPVLPALDHAVSRFMDNLWDHSNPWKSYLIFMVDTFDNHRQVWDNATLRKLASDILVAIGTNYIILNTMDHGNKAAMIAITISVLEQYNGAGKGGFKLAACQASLVADDVRYGGEREIVRFYLKRISCTCLKAEYSMIKKSKPTRISGCSICKQVKVRSSMMLCGLCRARQYCCRECQAANWPSHKGQCRSIHEK